MIYTPMTVKAMKLAYRAHLGQVDHNNVPYIFHPYHVAEQMTDEISLVVEAKVLGVKQEIINQASEKVREKLQEVVDEAIEKIIYLETSTGYLIAGAVTTKNNNITIAIPDNT